MIEHSESATHMSCNLYLIIGKLEPWLFAICENLPQNDPEAPNVALCGELPVHDAFWGHPAYRQHGVTPHLNTVHDEKHHLKMKVRVRNIWTPTHKQILNVGEGEGLCVSSCNSWKS